MLNQVKVADYGKRIFLNITIRHRHNLANIDLDTFIYVHYCCFTDIME